MDALEIMENQQARRAHVSQVLVLRSYTQTTGRVRFEVRSWNEGGRVICSYVGGPYRQQANVRRGERAAFRRARRILVEQANDLWPVPCEVCARPSHQHVPRSAACYAFANQA